MHETLARFGYPDSLVHETAHWAVVLRDRQVTAGALVLICRHDVRRVPDVPAAAWADMPAATGALESALAGALDFRKINYLLLMMSDPQVHFHVIPRYDGPRTAVGVAFEDPGWPGAPDLSRDTPLTAAQFADLRDLLRRAAGRGG